MLVQGSLLETTLHHSIDNHYTIDEDEDDETLSFSDLPLHSTVARGEDEDLSMGPQGLIPMPPSNQDYFEFLNQGFDPCFPSRDMISCGKLIPYKQLDTSIKDSPKAVDNGKQTRIKRRHLWRLIKSKFRANMSSKKQVRSKNDESTTLKHMKEYQLPGKVHKYKKLGKPYGSPVQKASVLTSTPSGKARWHLIFFGFPRLSTEVELSDIRSRQSRRQCPPPPPPPPAVGYLNRDDKAASDQERNIGVNVKLWGLIKVLSCDNYHHPSTMVASSIR